MKILVADDDAVCRHVLELVLRDFGYDTVPCADGDEAWRILEQPDAPPLAILDWLMPGLNGDEICRRVRARATTTPTYLIILTIKDSRKDLIAGLQSGADDYIPKPFDYEELRVRVQVGERVVKLQQALARQVIELQNALTRVSQLRQIIPICKFCKKVRDDQNFWDEVESYLARHSQAKFCEGVCPDCQEVRLQLERDAV